MSTFLRVAALFVSIVTLGLWFFGGFNFGRTKTFVPVEHVGPDGQSTIVRETRFLPGLDFVAGGLLVSLALILVSILPPRRNSPADS